MCKLKTLEEQGILDSLRKNKFYTITDKDNKILEFISRETISTSEK